MRVTSPLELLSKCHSLPTLFVFNGVTGLIGPTLFTQTFAFFIRPDPPLSPQHSNLSTALDLPGAPFILASLMLLSAAVIAWRTTKAEG